MRRRKQLDILVRELWRWFRAQPGWLQSAGWMTAWPVVGAVYLWQWRRGGKFAKAAAIALLATAGSPKFTYKVSRAKSEKVSRSKSEHD